MQGSLCPIRPELTVIIPFLNERRFLRETVQSILSEGLKSVEILLVDDGSSDDSVESVADLPVSYYRHATNRGRSAARNTGVARSRGKWITFIDGDDLLAPGALRGRLAWLRANASCRGVFGRLGTVIGPHGKPLPAFAKSPLPEPPPYLSSRFLIDTPAYPASVCLGIFHRTLFAEAGLFDDNFGRKEDRDMVIRLLKSSALPVLDIPVLRYRMHDRNWFHHVIGFSEPA